MDRTFWLNQTQLDAITAIAWLIGAIVAGIALHRVVYWLFARWAERQSTFAAAVVRRTRRPAAYIFPLLAILIVTPQLDLPPAWTTPAEHLTGLLTIAALAWTLIATIRLWGDIVIARHRIDVEDNLLARQLGTRVDILTRITVTIVILIATGMGLMTFPEIRALGTTLLASAGLVGIVAGLAARPLFENLVAGIELALTQPIRIDDVVIVEQQFGRIEEIHSTYVVIRLWDLRRMVVPLVYFINTPFENWTRRTANLIGEVFVFADWTLDVEALRAEVPNIVARSPLWDKQVQVVQVTDVTERAVQVRTLVSARNSSELFDLRCFVREAIVAYIRDHQPDAMPKLRVELPESANGDGDGDDAGTPSTDGRIARALATADAQQQLKPPPAPKRPAQQPKSWP
jgi:small-conductance mechanosensitive channel